MTPTIRAPHLEVLCTIFSRTCSLKTLSARYGRHSCLHNTGHIHEQAALTIRRRLLSQLTTTSATIVSRHCLFSTSSTLSKKKENKGKSSRGDQNDTTGRVTSPKTSEDHLFDFSQLHTRITGAVDKLK